MSQTPVCAANLCESVVPNREAASVDAQPLVIVVDDDAAFLDSLRALLASMSLTVECYSSGAAFLDAFREDAAGCLILDLKLADVDGFAVLDAVCNLAGAPPVVVMTAYADPPAVVRAFRYGIVAFLQKQSLSESALWEAIQQSFALDAARRKAVAHRVEVRSRFGRLTPGERSVLDLIVDGKDQGSIAESLKVSRRTVENRMACVREKLGVRTLPDLVRLLAEAEGIDGIKRP